MSSEQGRASTDVDIKETEVGGSEKMDERGDMWSCVVDDVMVDNGCLMAEWLLLVYTCHWYMLV